jgi:hypothetical protein
MQGIYTDDGALDYAAAAAQLSTLRGLGSATLKAEAVALVNAAALLDIAVSLSALVRMAGSEFDLGPETADDDDEAEPGEAAGPDGEPGEEPDEPFELGEYVRPREGASGPFGPISSMGESEGSTWLAVDLSDNEHEPHESARVWASGYERFVPMTESASAGAEVADHDEPDACGVPFETLDGDTALCQRKPGHKGGPDGGHKVKRGNS